jgi:hypothetical protein
LIAVSPDDAFGVQLASALAAVDLKVESYSDLSALGLDPLDGAFCVIHVAGAVAARLGDFVTNLARDCRIIAVLPRSDIVSLVEIMERTDRVIGMMVADDFSPDRLRSMAIRAISGDIFGLDKLVGPDTTVKSVLCEYEQRTLCRATIVAHAAQNGVPRRLFTAIEQCVDEMLMNALYDAPVDSTGKHVFAGVPVRQRVALGLATNVVVQYACDGNQFFVSVRDNFGSIERDIVLRVLHKCLHAAQKIDRKAGGAGVGLYLMLNAASAVYFNVVPGVATEAVCTFRIDRTKPQLEQFAFYRETVDVSGQLPTERPADTALRPTQLKRPLGPRLLLGGGIASAALLGLAIWHRVTAGPSKPAEPPKPATVQLDSKPTGAGVEVNGNHAGEAPVSLTTFPPGAQLTVTFKRKAFKPATITVRVPARGETTSHVETLVPSEDFVRVKFTTTPAGARLIDLTKPEAASADRTYTPVELFVEVGKEQRFMLTMPNRVPVIVPPFVPARGDGVLEKTAELATGSTVRVEGPQGARATIDNAPHCTNLELPADCTLAPGTYQVQLVRADGTSETKSQALAADDVTVTFDR